MSAAIVLVMRVLPDSPRRRKRAVALLVLAAAGGLAAVLALLLGNTAHPQKELFVQGKVKTAENQAPTRLSAADRRAVLAAVDRFVELGVARRNLAAAYDLTTVNLHGGVTREQWARGDIPIYPYPVYRHGARVLTAYPNDVMVQLILSSRGRKVEPLGVDVELIAVGKGAKRRWLIDYYQPRQTLGTAADRPKSAPGPKDPGLGPHLTKKWLLVPAGIFLLIVLVPIGLGLRDWLAGRSAERKFGKGRELPPLPPRARNES